MSSLKHEGMLKSLFALKRLTLKFLGFNFWPRLLLSIGLTVFSVQCPVYTSLLIK